MPKMFLFSIIALLLVVLSFSGCTVVLQKGRRVDVEKISRLQTELSEIERAKLDLEKRLAQEITDKEVTIEMLEKGLVITFVAEVLFDSGKAVIKTEAVSKIDKVSAVLKSVVQDLQVGIEGHTDNEPIKVSGWKSNWELSSARALSVVHLLVEEGVAPERLAALAYGEYHPVASNETPEGRQKNRRVEIVVLPPVSKEWGVLNQ